MESQDNTTVETMEAVAPSRAERRDQQMQRIMDAAKLCFVRSGFQGASMHHICAEAGMSPGALYRYFSSKEAMIEAISEKDRMQDAACFASLNESTSAVDGLVDAAIEHMRHVHESGNAPIFAEIRAESMRNEAIAEMCNRSRMPVAEMIRAQIVRGIERGEIEPVAAIDELMPMIMAIGEGLALNDLPSIGVSFEALETMLRAMVVGLLRPTGAPSA